MQYEYERWIEHEKFYMEFREQNCEDCFNQFDCAHDRKCKMHEDHFQRFIKCPECKWHILLESRMPLILCNYSINYTGGGSKRDVDGITTTYVVKGKAYKFKQLF